MGRADLECLLCHETLFQPVHLACGDVVCGSCCIQRVRTSGPNVCCPCCHDDGQHILTPDSIHAPSKVLLSLLDNLLITCKKCKKTVRAGDHTTHLQQGCREYTQVSPVQSDKKVASAAIKRLLSESKDGTISVSTSGKVLVNKL